MTKYESNFALWAEEQAKALRQQATEQLDWENLAEEIEDLARRHRDQIENRMIVIIEHLLKIRYLNDSNSYNGWKNTIIEQRRRIARVLKRNPALRSYPETILIDAYDDARNEIARYRPNLPETCPWTIDEVLNNEL